MAKQEPIVVDLVARHIQTEMVLEKLVDVAGKLALAERSVNLNLEALKSAANSLDQRDDLIKTLQTALIERERHRDELLASRKNQEAACAKLYESVDNLLRALPHAPGKLDRVEIERRMSIVRAALYGAQEYCDQIPF